MEQVLVPSLGLHRAEPSDFCVTDPDPSVIAFLEWGGDETLTPCLQYKAQWGWKVTVTEGKTSPNRVNFRS